MFDTEDDSIDPAESFELKFQGSCIVVIPAASVETMRWDLIEPAAAIILGPLKEQKVPVTLIGPDERDRPNSKSARVATMHRAKGLEFDEVVLVMPRQTGEPETTAHDTRRR